MFPSSVILRWFVGLPDVLWRFYSCFQLLRRCVCRRIRMVLESLPCSGQFFFFFFFLQIRTFRVWLAHAQHIRVVSGPLNLLCASSRWVWPFPAILGVSDDFWCVCQYLRIVRNALPARVCGGSACLLGSPVLTWLLDWASCIIKYVWSICGLCKYYCAQRAMYLQCSCFVATKLPVGVMTY